MNDVNYVALSGTIISPIELKITRIGRIPVVDFDLCVGRVGMEDDIIPCSATRSLAIEMSRTLKKDQRIQLKGALHHHKYKDKNGFEHTRITVGVENYCIEEGKPKPDISALAMANFL